MAKSSKENKIITKNQFGFKPGDSCINQLLSITHEIYKSFDDRLEVRGVFLDISKAFNLDTSKQAQEVIISPNINK